MLVVADEINCAVLLLWMLMIVLLLLLQAPPAARRAASPSWTVTSPRPPTPPTPPNRDGSFRRRLRFLRAHRAGLRRQRRRPVPRRVLRLRARRLACLAGLRRAGPRLPYQRDKYSFVTLAVLMNLAYAFTLFIFNEKAFVIPLMQKKSRCLTSFYDS